MNQLTVTIYRITWLDMFLLGLGVSFLVFFTVTSYLARRYKAQFYTSNVQYKTNFIFRFETVERSHYKIRRLLLSNFQKVCSYISYCTKSGNNFSCIPDFLSQKCGFEVHLRTYIYYFQYVCFIQGDRERLGKSECGKIKSNAFHLGIYEISVTARYQEIAKYIRAYQAG